MSADGSCYTVSAENQAIAIASGDMDLVELDAASDIPIELYGIGIYPLTEVQEAQEEWLRCAVIRGHTTTGNGTSTTPRSMSPISAAAGFTAKIAGATIASAGTAVTMHPFGVNVRAGYEVFYPAGSGILTSGTSLIVVRLMAAAADDFNASLCFWVRELL